MAKQTEKEKEAKDQETPNVSSDAKDKDPRQPAPIEAQERLDQTVPGGRYIVNGAEVNAQGKPFGSSFQEEGDE